jgi:hypothetical protein
MVLPGAVVVPLRASAVIILGKLGGIRSEAAQGPWGPVPTKMRPRTGKL